MLCAGVMKFIIFHMVQELLVSWVIDPPEHFYKEYTINSMVVIETPGHWFEL
jgi:hypothetical protein